MSERSKRLYVALVVITSMFLFTCPIATVQAGKDPLIVPSCQHLKVPLIVPPWRHLNPLATSDQLEGEAVALKVVATPVVQAAKEIAVESWLAEYEQVFGESASQEQRAYLEQAVEEKAFGAALMGQGDP